MKTERSWEGETLPAKLGDLWDSLGDLWDLTPKFGTWDHHMVILKMAQKIDFS